MRLPKLMHFFMVSLVAACLIMGGCAAPVATPPATPVDGPTTPASAGHKLGTAYYPGSLTTINPNFAYPQMPFTATSQTVTQPLSGQSFCTFEIIDATVTTMTIGFDVSNDGGITWFPLPVAPFVAGTLVPTTTAITISSGPAHAYVANVSGWTNLEAISSGTFTATGVYVQPTCTSNGGYIMNIG